MREVDKKRVYELVERAVDDEIMQLCSNDAQAEVLSRVCPGAFGFEAFGEGYDDIPDYWDCMNLADEMIIDVMARRGYVLEDGELASRSISCFEYLMGHDGRPDRYNYWFGDGLHYVTVFASGDGTWHASETNGTHVTWVGNGDTPQRALDDLRMVKTW